MTESKDTIDDRLDADFAEAWKPEPGDKLVGEVVAISEREGGFGKYPIVTVQPEEGEPVAIHAFRTVLASKLAEARPKVGERIGVKYEGEREGTERRYHSYRVAVDRPEQGVDWSTYSEDVPAEPVRTTSDVPADTSGLVNATLEQGSDEDDVPF